MKTTRWIIVGFLGLTHLAQTSCSNGQTQTAPSGQTQSAPSEAPVDSAPRATTAMAQHEQVVEVAVTSDGFVPASFEARVGHPLKLIVTRKVELTCATDVVIKALQISEPLPLNKAVEVTFTPTVPGKIRFGCAMDMTGGEIIVK